MLGSQPCSCRYIAESEYGALSSYMTQRLPLSKVCCLFCGRGGKGGVATQAAFHVKGLGCMTLAQVNTAVEDAADLAESNMRMLAHARAGGKMPTQDWKRAQGLLVNIAVSN